MNRKLSALLAAAALGVSAACGATPTGSAAAPPSDPLENTTQADTSTGRVPNLFGSGN